MGTTARGEGPRSRSLRLIRDKGGKGWVEEKIEEWPGTEFPAAGAPAGGRGASMARAEAARIRLPPSSRTCPFPSFLPVWCLSDEKSNERFRRRSAGEEGGCTDRRCTCTAGGGRILRIRIWGGAAVPGAVARESDLRWGFVRKVYGILAAQLLLTTAVSPPPSLSRQRPPPGSPPAPRPRLPPLLVRSPFILFIPLHHYQQKHPLNFVFLGLFTICLSLSVGVACANTQGKIVLEALILTSAVVSSLTGYAFWASKKGKDFSYLGPALFASLIVLLVTSFMQIFFPLGPTSVALFGGLGALIFSGFLLYDTDNLIKRYTYDEYIWASVVLYLDILNLFLSLLNMLRSMQSDN
ncbi:BI1-like protein [Ananas comosus]|uniref:BI1-like protein n=1 Tax=Ananas comosus TaxID=4615 RepID=A0A6P5F039_ANACO|nr:BI1-like protein [Ananas comosus]